MGRLPERAQPLRRRTLSCVWSRRRSSEAAHLRARRGSGRLGLGRDRGRARPNRGCRSGDAPRVPAGRADERKARRDRVRRAGREGLVGHRGRALRRRARRAGRACGRPPRGDGRRRRRTRSPPRAGRRAPCRYFERSLPDPFRRAAAAHRAFEGSAGRGRPGPSRGPRRTALDLDARPRARRGEGLGARGGRGAEAASRGRRSSLAGCPGRTARARRGPRRGSLRLAADPRAAKRPGRPHDDGRPRRRRRPAARAVRAAARSRRRDSRRDPRGRRTQPLDRDAEHGPPPREADGFHVLRRGGRPSRRAGRRRLPGPGGFPLRRVPREHGARAPRGRRIPLLALAPRRRAGPRTPHLGALGPARTVRRLVACVAGRHPPTARARVRGRARAGDAAHVRAGRGRVEGDFRALRGRGRDALGGPLRRRRAAPSVRRGR